MAFAKDHVMSEENEPTHEQKARKAAAEAVVARLPGAKVLSYYHGEHGGPDAISLRIDRHYGGNDHETFRFFEVASLERFVAWLAARDLAEAREVMNEHFKRGDAMAERARRCEAIVAELGSR